MTAWHEKSAASDVSELFDLADELLDPVPHQCGPCCNELDCVRCPFYVGEVKEVKHD